MTGPGDRSGTDPEIGVGAPSGGFRKGAFGLAQYNLADSPLGFEVSHYNETGHHHTTAAVRYNLGSSKWFLRAGAIWAEKDQPFIGVGYNGF